MAEVDLANRDPNQLNEHLQVAYEELIGEPDHTQSIDCVWTNSYKCFNLWKGICYKILSTLCGICIACFWGCYFAAIAFEHIWILTPALRAYKLHIWFDVKIYEILVGACCDPLCNSCSKMFDAFRK